jgi:hypothetical protein
MSGDFAFRRGRAARVVASVAMGLVAFASTPAARAATTPVTFADFSEATGASNANQFVYTDNGAEASAQLTTSAACIPVVFDFVSIPGLPADLSGPQNAMLTLTNVTTTSAVDTIPISLSQTIAVQSISGDIAHSQVLTITRDKPASEGSGSMDVLLQMTFTGELAGLLGTRIPILQGSTTTGNIVSYASDFLAFTSAGASSDFNVAFSSWNTDSDNNGLEQSLTPLDTNFGSATAAGAGTFDTTISAVTIGGGIPEPTGSMVAAAIGGIAMLRRRRRQIAGC